MGDQRGAVVLAADSEALFRDGSMLLAAIRSYAEVAGSEPSAVYLGASNGDHPAYAEIFAAAMDAIGVRAHCHVRADASDEVAELALSAARIILLAGGDVAQGMEAFHRRGWPARFDAAHRAGAVLVGVSAGAVQLGVGWLEPGASTLRAALGLVPFVIGVHEPPEWPILDATVRVAGGYTPGLGIAKGGAAIVHPSGEIQPVHRALCEVATVAHGHAHSVLSPSAS